MLPPAFAKKKPKRLSEDEYRGLEQQSVVSKLNFMKKPTASQGSALGPWNNFGIQSKDVSATNVDSLFVSNRKLLDDEHFVNQRSSHRNAQDQTDQGTTIFNEIGDSIVGSVTLESETRLDHLDDDGKWIGSNLGQLRKRHRDEFRDRVTRRAAQKQIVCSILSHWDSLSPEEQRSRQRQAEANMKQILSSVQVVETEEIPPEYLFSRLTIGEAPLNHPHSEFLQQVDEEPERPLKRVVTYKHASKSRLRDPNYISGSVSPSSYGTPASSTTGYNTPESGYTTPGFFHFSGHNRSRNRRPRPPPPPPSIPAHHQWHDLGNVSYFPVTNTKPDITPLEDLMSSMSLNDDVTDLEELTAKIDALTIRCSTEPRVVIVQLQPGLAFSAQKLLERCKSANLQEIQFFPDEGEAALFFLDPRDAECFVKHIECARSSDHETRRLQIAASWIKGIRLDSIYPAQENILRLVVAENVSRCIKVNDIPTNVRHDYLEAHFKGQFPNLIGLRLIRPTKTYEKQKANSTCALLDFQSIICAVAARAAFEGGHVANFEDCTSEYVSDPCRKPYDRAAWCTCRHCLENEPEGDVTTNYGSLYGRHASHLNMARNNETYTPMADSQRPAAFTTKLDPGSKPMERDI